MRRALATLAALHAADAAFECVRDAHGCCSSAGYFFCGSSGRCTGRDDPCEDGSGAAAATCGATLKRDGAVASWDLTGLTRTSSLLDYEAGRRVQGHLQRLCQRESAQVCPSSKPAAPTRSRSNRAKPSPVGGRRGHGVEPLVGRTPPRASPGLFWPGRCSFLLRVRCSESAVEPSNLLVSSRIVPQ